MKVLFLAAAAMAGLMATPALAVDVPGGVYDCFGPHLAAGDSHLDLEMSGAKFSVISPGTYLSRGGATGHFTFDGKTLAMTNGPYAGLKFHKVADWSFRMLRDNGDEGPFMCPRNTAKDMHAPNKW